ncbi:hypothetical protein [Vibrio parahaemolyticus]|uniref:hypothetical protein n=1 Tax=Vibrio parahaemolyticus TaxID=670 RepID=UPI001CEC44E4|nr:hypothetical protein [Vibrio parahaemolyticus]
MTWEFIERKEAFDYIGLNNKSVNEIEQFLHRRVRISAALFSNKKLYLSRQSLIMLASLNEYDQKQVIKEMYFLSSNPSAPSVVRHKRNPLPRIFRTRYPFKNYHYLLTCILIDGNVVIHDIAFDERLHGKEIGRHPEQRTQMYHVKKIEGRRSEYDGTQSNEEAELLLAEWDHAQARSTHQVNTLHASVNGMLNDYEKAATLMGVHTQVADTQRR